jgi:excisionase family DNA binding protein
MTTRRRNARGKAQTQTPAAMPAGEGAELLTLALPERLLEEIARRAAELALEVLEQPPPPPWLGLKEAADYLGFSRQKLYKLTAARAIPYRKKRGGQGLLFRRDELDAWLESAYPPEARLS